MEYATNGELFDHIVHKLNYRRMKQGSKTSKILRCGPFADMIWNAWALESWEQF